MSDPSNILSEWLAKKVGPEKIGEAIDQLVKDGWVKIDSPHRQQYHGNIIDLIWPQLKEAGFVRVRTPTFQIGRVLFTVKVSKITDSYPATDWPGDLVKDGKLLQLVLDHLRGNGYSHVMAITAARLPLFGYLPPVVQVMCRAARTKATAVTALTTEVPMV